LTSRAPVPLAAVAGADDKAISLLYQQDELPGHHQSGMHHQEAMMTGGALAQQARPPLTAFILNAIPPR